MLKEMLASGGAKLIAACVCPVVGVGALTIGVPKMRSAVHTLTAPAKPVARSRLRARAPARAAAVRPGAEIICPQISGIGPSLSPIGIAGLSDLAAPRVAGDQAPIAAGKSPVAGPGIAGISSQPTGGGGGGGGGGGFLPPDDGAPGTQPGLEPPDVAGPVENPGPSAEPPSAIVPEPSTWAQLLLGFALLGGVVRYARQHRARSKTAPAP